MAAARQSASTRLARTNGIPVNGRPRGELVDDVDEDDDQTDENIFLFYPNLIGLSNHVRLTCSGDTDALHHRLLPNCPRHRISVFHASASTKV
nr:hypothetical protein CFP56_54967 [Quercus suber]POF24045.1 hypothetical protein CFP56_54981 [Quercus suber]